MLRVQETRPAWSARCRPSHSSARSGWFGVCESLQSSWPATTSLSFGRHWKSGPSTRFHEPPSRSRSDSSRLTKLWPRSRRTRPIPTNDRSSWSAKLEPFGPGITTWPPPRSSATSAVKSKAPHLPVPRGAEARRGDRARVDRLDRRREEVDALEEERPLLRVEEREALVGRDLRDVGLDLREVRVHGGVDRGPGARRPLDVEPGLAVNRSALERRARPAGRRRGLLRAHVGHDHEVARARAAA